MDAKDDLGPVSIVFTDMANEQLISSIDDRRITGNSAVDEENVVKEEDALLDKLKMLAGFTHNSYIFRKHIMVNSYATLLAMRSQITCDEIFS